MAAVHQLIAGAGKGDAITNYAFEIQKLFSESGINSDIFSPLKHIAKEFLKGAVKDQNELLKTGHEDDILIYHYSIGSVATNIYKKINTRKLICYHNVTPAKYFKTLSDEQVEALQKGREELKDLVPITKIALAVSEYNRKELADIGFTDTKVIPLVFPRDYLKTKPDPDLINKLCDKKINLLFVGRVVPNKRFEDLIKIFYYFNKTINTSSRLLLVGSYAGNEKYYTYLKSLVFDLKLTGNVIFTGHVSLEELLACYTSANAFICMSEHEGFGLPLIESMYFNIPVFALNKAAVAETLGGSGILINTTDHKIISELINTIIKNSKLLNEILIGQKKRFEYFNTSSLKKELKEILIKYYNFTM